MCVLFDTEIVLHWSFSSLLKGLSLIYPEVMLSLMQTHKFYFKRLIISTAISLHLLFFKCGTSTLHFMDCICQLPKGCQLCYAIKGTALRGLSVKSVVREISRIFIPTLSNIKIKQIYLTTLNTEAFCFYFIVQMVWTENRIRKSESRVARDFYL